MEAHSPSPAAAVSDLDDAIQQLKDMRGPSSVDWHSFGEWRIESTFLEGVPVPRCTQQSMHATDRMLAEMDSDLLLGGLTSREVDVYLGSAELMQWQIYGKARHTLFCGEREVAYWERHASAVGTLRTIDDDSTESWPVVEDSVVRKGTPPWIAELLSQLGLSDPGLPKPVSSEIPGLRTFLLQGGTGKKSPRMG